VHCSTVGVLGHVATPPADETTPYSPGDPYQRTKCEAEVLALTYARERGVPVTVARPTAIYGPGDRRLLKMFRMIANRTFVMLGKGDIYYHMVYIDDLVDRLEPELSPSEIFAALFELELAGKIRQMPGKNFVKTF